jgi:hypothetical protein
VPIAFESSPPVVVDASTGLATSQPFTPPAGALLIAVAFSETAAVEFAITDSIGLTWAEQVRTTLTGNGTCAIFTAWAPAPVQLTVQAASGSDDVALASYVASGVDPVTPIGHTYSERVSTANYTPTVYASTRAGSWAVGGGTEYTAAGACSSADVFQPFDAGSDMKGVAVRKAAAASAANQAVTLNFATAASTPQWALAAIELLPAAEVVRQRSAAPGSAAQRAASW